MTGTEKGTQELMSQENEMVFRLLVSETYGYSCSKNLTSWEIYILLVRGFIQ